MARKRADYRPRIADAELAELLAASGAVLLEGARAVGKTATAMQASASHVLLDIDLDAQRMMSIDPAAVLTGTRLGCSTSGSWRPRSGTTFVGPWTSARGVGGSS